MADAVIARFKWLDRLAIFSLTFFSAVVLTKLLGQSGVRLLGITVPLSLTVLALLVLTIIHSLVTNLILASLRFGWREINGESRRNIYDKVVGSGGILVRGSFSYRDAIFKKKADTDVVYVFLKTRIDDPPVIIQIALTLLTAMACVPFEISGWTLIILAATISLVSLNWQIGANWAIGLVNFARPRNEDFLFSEKYGPRTVSTVSGFWLNEQSSWGLFFS